MDRTPDLDFPRASQEASYPHPLYPKTQLRALVYLFFFNFFLFVLGAHVSSPESDLQSRFSLFLYVSSRDQTQQGSNTESFHRPRGSDFLRRHSVLTQSLSPNGHIHAHQKPHREVWQVSRVHNWTLLSAPAQLQPELSPVRLHQLTPLPPSMKSQEPPQWNFSGPG